MKLIRLRAEANDHGFASHRITSDGSLDKTWDLVGTTETNEVQMIICRILLTETCMKMKASNRQVMHVFFLQLHCLFQWHSNANSSALYPFVFFWLLFTTRQVFSISFGLTSRQTETRDICVPCFCMALKECMQRRILGGRVQHQSEKKALLFSDELNSMHLFCKFY